MKNILLIFALPISMVLAGCVDPVKPEPTNVVEKLVPVKCKPSIQITQISEYPLDTANKEMTLFEKSQLALAENSLIKGQNKELKAALAECTE
jgi:hypothetical protein